MSKLNTYREGPDESGHFDIYGGRYVAETLMPLILQVQEAWEKAKNDAAFWDEFNRYMKHYVGRPSPLYLAERLTAEFGGAKVYFKRDELNHTGAHKINNTIGQILRAPDSTASPRPRSAPCLVCPAWSTWVRRMSPASAPTWCA